MTIYNFKITLKSIFLEVSNFQAQRPIEDKGMPTTVNLTYT